MQWPGEPAISLRVLGSGWVGPGRERSVSMVPLILEGQSPDPVPLSCNNQGSFFLHYPVSEELLKFTSRLPRLRRSSSISLYAVAAALEAVEDAGISPEELVARRTSLVFAASDGSVVYTRKFFEGVLREGAGGGSPLLFPETVYNAPASHVSAALGLTGNSLSLVGDAAVGIEACRVAGELLAMDDCDLALVVAAEEVDPISCEGYAAWKIARQSGKERGAVFTEGAAALLVEKGGDGCALFPARSQAANSWRGAASNLKVLLQSLDLADEAPDEVVISDAGTRVGVVETRLVGQCFPRSQIFAPKRVLGEGLAAATLWQVIFAQQRLRSGDAATALITVLGYNGISSAILLRNEPS